LKTNETAPQNRRQKCGAAVAKLEFNIKGGNCEAGKMTTVVNRRKAKFDVYIGRPSKWGNPFSHMAGTLAKFRVGSRDEALISYEKWIQSKPDLMAAAKIELKGKVLGCWCKPASCHGDILAAIADSEVAR
jgi:hypothetical protein